MLPGTGVYVLLPGSQFIPPTEQLIVTQSQVHAEQEGVSGFGALTNL